MRGKDWPNLQRMFAALVLLLISPLIGIAVGAICWSSLERGLLIFNLLGLAGFTLLTKPYWLGNKARIRRLLAAFCAIGFSALLDVLSGRPIPFAVYFSSMVECFSLIPWITEILQEIHQGRWRQRPNSPPAAPPVPGQRRTPPLRPEYPQEGPELSIPGFPRWGYILLILLLGLILLFPLTSYQSGAESSPTPEPTPALSSEPAPEPEPDYSLPALFAENERWQVYLDDWVYTQVDGSVMDLSVYDKEGTLYQRLRSTSHSTGPHPWQYLDYDGRVDPPVLLADLNFDGIDDIRVDYETIRCGAYAAFLWNEEEERFIEEPTFTQIKRPHPMDGMIFGCCSSGASNTYYTAYTYNPETGYQPSRLLNIDIVESSEGEYQAVYTEYFYENGELIDTVQTKDHLETSDFWQNYFDYADQHIWG